MSEQHIVRFAFKGEAGRLPVDKYRKNLGRDTTLPHLLFWRNERHQQIVERSQLRWLKSHQGFSLVAPPDYKTELLEASGLLLGALSEQYKEPVTIRHFVQGIDAIESDGINHYQASVLTRMGRIKRASFDDSREADKRAFFETFIAQELLRESYIWDADDALIESFAHRVKVTFIKELLPAKITNNKGEVKRIQKRFMLNFHMPIHLRGFWSAGSQISKGHGSIKHQRTEGA